MGTVRNIVVNRLFALWQREFVPRLQSHILLFIAYKEQFGCIDLWMVSPKDIDNVLLIAVSGDRAYNRGQQEPMLVDYVEIVQRAECFVASFIRSKRQDNFCNVITKPLSNRFV